MVVAKLQWLFDNKFLCDYKRDPTHKKYTWKIDAIKLTKVDSDRFPVVQVGDVRVAHDDIKIESYEEMGKIINLFLEAEREMKLKEAIDYLKVD